MEATCSSETSVDFQGTTGRDVRQILHTSVIINLHILTMLYTSNLQEFTQDCATWAYKMKV
jgi:hypothetical protein